MPQTPQSTNGGLPANFAFVIDNRKCIGCHACSVACKSENDVPLSVNRTWVKYVETGLYPDSRRHFQVTRCNHCANPPCVRICPTSAMFQRPDGIVEFDSAACIGCKACLQACPYDAIYIDPESHTAAKCNYCAHRIEVGLEPACVVVCPEHAIIAGDKNDPSTEIAQLIANEKVTVRKPEQGTKPNLYYIEGTDASLQPDPSIAKPETYMWADRISEQGEDPKPRGSTRAAGPAATGRPGLKGLGGSDASVGPGGTPEWSPETETSTAKPTGPIRQAGQMVQVAYNAQHEIPWHWPVPAYIVTKAIGAGVFLVAALLALFGQLEPGRASAALALASLVFMGITTALLVLDLEKPARFLYILMRPQWRSWLTRGAVVLIGQTMIATAWLLHETGFLFDAIPREAILIPGAVFSLLAATYTAFLFAQAEGRDLWQSPLLPVQHLLHAVATGGAAASLILWLVPVPITADARAPFTAFAFFLLALGLGFLFHLLAELGMRHPTDVAEAAARDIHHGRYKWAYRFGALGLGFVAPLAIGIYAFTVGVTFPAMVCASVFAVIGFFIHEYAFVMAPQRIPNS